MIMSRSKRKNPIVAFTSHESDKPYRKAEHKRERAQVRLILRATADDTALPSPKVFGDPVKGLKDGKLYVGHFRTETKRELHKLTGK
jgi:hypothetical protein